MPSLKELRNRIAAVKATQKITKAMQMVAAAKLRRAQEAAEAARPYAERMGAVLANLSRTVDAGTDTPPLMVGTGRDDRHLLVVATADRGLCGAFNSSIVRKALGDYRLLTAEGKTVKFLCVGKKGYEILRRNHQSDIVELIDFRNVRQVGFSEADTVGHKIIAMFDNGDFDVATLYFNTFRSVISQIPTAAQLIPAHIGDEDDTKNDAAAGSGDAIYEYEPDEGAILADLVPRNISVQVFRALLENAASEQGARMSAMDNATRNAGEMIQKLTLQYNRSRQAQITKELIEIISGAEAL